MPGDTISSSPEVSVILSTYNRASLVGRAVKSVLSQSGVHLELVVVDDGSTDNTQAVLAGVVDARLRYVRQNNRGLSASRNIGARHAQGEWLLFLDDDDRLLEGALEMLFAPTRDPSCRVVVGGFRYVDADGRILCEAAPRSLDHALAGTFLISRTLFNSAGGYLEGMPCSHQTELFLRVRRLVGDRPGAISTVREPVVDIESRPPSRRPEQSPAHSYFGARWLAARHPDEYTNRLARATVETAIGVSAMRIGREAEARRRFASAIRHDPLSPARYVRLAAAIVAPVGRRIWLRQWDSPPETPRLLDRVRRPAAPDDPSDMSLEHDPSPGPDSLFLPWQYRQNARKSSGGEALLSQRNGLEANDIRLQAPIYRLAARLVRAKGLVPVVDIRCGSGHNLVRYVGKVTDVIWFDEGDLDDDAAWDQVSRLNPRLVICSGLAERVADPRRLLSRIRRAVSDGGIALISTPDRSRRQAQEAMGPPANPLHLREWSAEEFSLLLESCGLEIVRIAHRLPRAYSPTLAELKRLVWRAVHLQPVPDRRSSMAFLVRAARDDVAVTGRLGTQRHRASAQVANINTSQSS
jgi:SAM-dependent methyltransferase